MEYLLGGLLLISNIYWAFVNHKLVNKLMSRNYADYQVANTITDKKDVKVKEPIDDFHPEDLGNLTQF